MAEIRPKPPLLDSSLNNWILGDEVISRREKIIQTGESTAIVYVTFIPVGKDESERVYTCSSWWILEHNSRKVGVTALHVLDNANMNTVELYISKDQDNRKADVFSLFETFRISKIHNRHFDHVDLRMDLLEERRTWIETNKSNVPFMQQHNLDPEFGLQPHPVLDILFTTIPESMSKYPGFTVAKNEPQENSIFGHIGFHNEHEPTDERMYEETVKRPPKANQLLFGGRSVSLGRVHKPGSIITVISTNSEGSSGGCLINDDVEVFAISFASFYDDPEAVEDDPTDSNLPSEPLLLDVDIIEKGNSKSHAPRNRNLVLSMFHPGVVACLSKI
eukprot:TRINITY_DN3119_c2_g1_i4.p1 TRINITY_DN3119_c2_g1~~TRINITY_DN3119_c2_g1_i4.p1  ORF type:complete len:333 (+),score=31.97 TRINITY_DN3119_c2_g1_i4:189-1187(+)